ncbi:MAG: hypothetical protein PHY47_14445 [Lachnospiraceae bacterium]|nr:hypothetical protein [Lachnospiraceae bacterium]
MKKKKVQFISLTLTLCMLISSVVFAEEAGPISNMTYEEWLVEQESVSDLLDATQSDLEPVTAVSQKQEQSSKVSTDYSSEKSGNILLDSILKEKGKYRLNKEINLDLKAESVTASISRNVDLNSDLVVNDAEAGDSTEQVNDAEAGDSTEQVNDVEAGDSTEQVNDAEAEGSTEQVNDAEAGDDEEQVNDAEAGDSTEQVNDVEAEGSTEQLNGAEAGDDEEQVNDAEAGDSTEQVNSDKQEKSVNDMNLARTAPTAGLIPVIINEESLIDGQITTDTIIAFLFDDTDTDGDTIVNRFVDGSAVNYILGEINGGFVIQITEPGTYQLYYQVKDSAGEFSRVLGYTIDVIAAPIVEEYQVFEGSFSSLDDSKTYNFSIDFTEMNSAAVCLVRKGYIGTKMQVFDESGNEILIKGTGSRQAKNWGFIDKPSADATICNYTVEVSPYSYDGRASNYRIIIGDKNDTELMMSGIENTVLLEQYYEAKVNLENSAYVPNVGEYWYKYKRQSTSVITIPSDVSDIRFKILDVNTLKVLFDSATDSSTHRTSFVDSGSWTCAEKARLTTVVGTEYYLVVYSTNPTSNLSLRTGSMATAVGNPVMAGSNTRVSPGISITLPSTGYSSTMTCNVTGDDLPKTGQVREVSLSVSGLSNVERWKAKAPNLSSWVTNPSSFWITIDMNYKDDSSGNARLKGAWSTAFMASSSGKGKSISPNFNFYYNYEYGD